jgi:hypothetical protein
MVIGDRVRAFREGFRAALRREELPPPPAAPAQPATVNPLHRANLARQPLGLDPEPSATPQRSALSAIFAREPLGFDPEPAESTQRSVLSFVFASETLGQDAPAPPRHRSRWFTWLFRPEPLDD